MNRRGNHEPAPVGDQRRVEEDGDREAGKGPSIPGPESVPTEEDAERKLPGVPDEAAESASDGERPPGQ